MAGKQRIFIRRAESLGVHFEEKIEQARRTSVERVHNKKKNIKGKTPKMSKNSHK